MRSMPENYLRTDARWGNWYLGRGSSTLFNVRHGHVEFAFDDLDSVETLALRVRHTVTKSWCVGAESADLCRAIESVTGLGVYIRREGYRPGGPISAATVFRRALSGSEHVKVL